MTIKLQFFSFVLIALCAAFVASPAYAATGTINADTLSVVYGSKPTFAGTADDVETVRFEIENEKGKVVYKSSFIKVKDGEWKKRISKKLAKGEYEVTLTGKTDGKLTTLATESLLVAKKSRSRKDGELTASMLPLLMGGSATSAASIPVAYVKVYNNGSASTTIKGFTLKENGMAPDFVVTGFSTSDDKGGSRTTTTNRFKDGVAFVPLAATFAPGQIRIFTIKASLSATSYGSIGKEFKIDVASVDSDNATIRGVFPLRGTTWKLAY